MQIFLKNKSKEYAVKFHEAFILQSVGQSSAAFNRFLEAFRLGTDSGESPRKLQAVANIFYWYRQHGSCMKIFAKQPSSKEKIHGEYCICGQTHECDEYVRRNAYKTPILALPHHFAASLAVIPDYQSEYGTTPKQAATVRELMFGIGEVISGIFIFYCSPLKGTGGGLAVHGAYLIGTSLHNLYTEHDIAMLELKKLTDEAEAAAKQ